MNNEMEFFSIVFDKISSIVQQGHLFVPISHWCIDI